MITIIVGRQIPGEESTIVTGCTTVDKPHKVVIEMPNKNALVRALTPGKPKWANYVKGIINKTKIKISLTNELLLLKGVIANYKGDTPAFQAVIVTSVPIGGGLSSSASLEVATYTFLDALNPPNSFL